MGDINLATEFLAKLTNAQRRVIVTLAGQNFGGSSLREIGTTGAMMASLGALVSFQYGDGCGWRTKYFTLTPLGVDVFQLIRIA